MWQRQDAILPSIRVLAILLTRDLEVACDLAEFVRLKSVSRTQMSGSNEWLASKFGDSCTGASIRQAPFIWQLWPCVPSGAQADQKVLC